MGELTERRIQHAIYHKRRTQDQLIVPNYTPAQWWECDVLTVTKAGYPIEWEVKLTVGDYVLDGRKMRDGQLKHDLLAAGMPRGPSRFYFCTPRGLLDDLRVPDWAGLAVFDWDAAWGRAWGPTIIKPAPKLHGNKWDQRIYEHARGVCYYRYWDERFKRDRMEEVGNA